MTRAGSLVGPDTSLCSSTNNAAPPNSNAPISFSLASGKHARYQFFIASTWLEPMRTLPNVGTAITNPSRQSV